MERTKYWYSVISYQTDQLKNERLNVGVIIHSPEKEFLKWYIIDDRNKKLKSILTNSVLQEEYKVKRALLEIKFEKSLQNSSLISYQVADPKLLEYVSIDSKDLFIFSAKQLVKSANIDSVIKLLLETYVDKLFLDKEISANGVKQLVKYAFEEYHLLGVKVKSDISITPIKEVDLNYKIDFAYKNSHLHFVQAVPSNPNKINEWFSKMKLFQHEYKDKNHLEIIFNNSTNAHSKDISPILSYLNKDSSTEIINIGSSNFNNYCNNISINSVSIKELESDLIAI